MDKLFRTGIRQRAQNGAVENAEHGCVRTDAEGQGEDDDDRETRCSPDHAKRVLKIAPQIRPYAQAPRFPNCFLAGSNAAKVRERNASRVASGAGALHVLGFHLEVEADLTIKVALRFI